VGDDDDDMGKHSRRFFFFYYERTRVVSHLWPLPFTLKSILRQKKNDGNSNISPCKNIPNLQKTSSKRKTQNPSRYYNSVTNLKFQHKPKYHLSKTLI
jgi:hypothetical protein